MSDATDAGAPGDVEPPAGRTFMPRVIATRRLYCVLAGGTGARVTVIVWAPVPREGVWQCSAALEGLYRDTVDARGVDSLQALQLALAQVREALAAVLDAGGRIHWEDGSGELGREDLAL